MAHTPGKWYYRENIGQINAENNCNSICNIHPHGEKRGADENRANAKLIASAPELLEACKYALQHLHPAGNIQNDFEGHNAIATLTAAINKAEEV